MLKSSLPLSEIIGYSQNSIPKKAMVGNAKMLATIKALIANLANI